MQIQFIRAHSLRAIHNKYPAPVVNQRTKSGEIDPIARGIIHPVERQNARAGVNSAATSSRVTSPPAGWITFTVTSFRRR